MRIRATIPAVLCLTALWALPISGQVSLSKSERDGQPVYVIENKYVRSEIAYTRARSPLSYFDKITQVEQLRQLAPLNGNHGKHTGHGGVAEAVPWTGGSPYMGYLWTQPWEMTARTYDDHVVLTGEITFPYPDPVTGRLCELRFQKTMTAYEGSTRLKMDYHIQNVGDRPARFQHCVHGSPCVGGTCDDGDYFFAPGDRSWVVWSSLFPQLKIPDQSWHSWPFDEAVDFTETDAEGGLQLFVPARWGVMGDDKTKEVMAMVSSPVTVGGTREIPVYMGYTRGRGNYYLEPSLTKHISNHDDRWEREGYSVDLDRGEACVSTVDMAMFHGVSKEQVMDVHSLTGDYLLLSAPTVKVDSKRARIDVAIAVTGDARLSVVEASTGEVLSATDLTPGNVQSIKEEVSLSSAGAEVNVLLTNAAGEQVLVGGTDG